MAPVLIAVDWGTTSFRAYLLGASGDVLDRVETRQGILAASEGASGEVATRRFQAVLGAAIARWRAAHPAISILMSGMIGSRQGWKEAPYVACPAGVEEIAAALVRVPADALDPVWLVPGLKVREDIGRPDVMRGEEVQVLGAILAGVGMSAASPESQKIVLPGTHSKWVSVVDRQIADLRTFMTGEVYAALKDHTILGRLMDGERPHADGFAQGVRAAAERGGPGWLLSALFSVRSLPLFDRLPTDALADYLSGLLIGSEIMEGAGPGQSFTVLAGDALLSRYTDAACILGCMAIPLASDCIVQGYLAIAQARGLVEAGKATEQRPKIGHNECGGAL